MTFQREDIVIAGRTTSAHLTVLEGADRIEMAPATHRGVCLAVPGIEPGMTFGYASQQWTVLKAWDEAAAALPEPSGRHQKKLDDAEAAYHRNRKGKFIDLLLIAVPVDGSGFVNPLVA